MQWNVSWLLRFGGGGRFRGGVIARGAPIAVKNLVNFTTNLLTNFTTKCATSFTCALLRALLGRTVRSGTRVVLRVGESDGEGCRRPINVGSVGTRAIPMDSGRLAPKTLSICVHLCTSVVTSVLGCAE